MELEGILPWSQQLANRPFPKLDESNQCPPTYFIDVDVIFLSDFPTKILHVCLIYPVDATSQQMKEFWDTKPHQNILDACI
jgi:hypothetical protein